MVSKACLRSSFPLTHPHAEFICFDWTRKCWFTCLPVRAEKGVCAAPGAAPQSTVWCERVWLWWETSPFYSIYVPLLDMCLKMPPSIGKTGGKSVTAPHHLFCNKLHLLFLFICPLMHSYLFACFTCCLCPLGLSSDRHLAWAQGRCSPGKKY